MKGKLTTGIVGIAAISALFVGLVSCGSDSKTDGATPTTEATQATPPATTETPSATTQTPVRPAQVPADEELIVGIYEEASPAVVQIAAGLGTGSGFLIDAEGRLLTNSHVVDGASSVTVRLSDGTELDGEVLGRDASDDLAVVQVEASAVSHITPLKFGDSDGVKPGQTAIAIGSPFGLEGTLTVGVISGIDRTITGTDGRPITGVIQTDAALNPGNSGGALLNTDGEVIGINTAIESEAADGVGFAVPINTAKTVLSRLTAGEVVSRPWLGIAGMAVTSEIADSLDLAVDEGVYVLEVVPDSPADTAGLQGSGISFGGDPRPGGDVITAIGGQPAQSVADLIEFLNSKKVGDQVMLTVYRGQQMLELSVTLGAFSGG